MSTKATMSRPWLAGVCAWLAWRLGWSVVGVRLAVLVAALIAPLTTLAVYLLCALCLGLGAEAPPPPNRPARRHDPLDRRIDDMERRLAEFDRELAGRS